MFCIPGSIKSLYIHLRICVFDTTKRQIYICLKIGYNISVGYALLFNDFADCDLICLPNFLPGRTGDLFVNNRAIIILLFIDVFKNCLAVSAAASKDIFCSHFLFGEGFCFSRLFSAIE